MNKMKQVISEKLRAALLKQKQEYKKQKERLCGITEEMRGCNVPEYARSLKNTCFDFEEKD